MVFHGMSFYRPFGKKIAFQAGPSSGRKWENLSVSSDFTFVKCWSFGCYAGGRQAGLHHLEASVSHQTMRRVTRDEWWGTHSEVLNLVMSPQNTRISG